MTGTEKKAAINCRSPNKRTKSSPWSSMGDGLQLSPLQAERGQKTSHSTTASGIRCRSDFRIAIGTQRPKVLEKLTEVCHCFKVFGEAVRAASQPPSALLVSRLTSSGTPVFFERLKQGHPARCCWSCVGPVPLAIASDQEAGGTGPTRLRLYV